MNSSLSSALSVSQKFGSFDKEVFSSLTKKFYLSFHLDKKYYLVPVLISYMTHWLFKSLLVNFHSFENFSVFILIFGATRTKSPAWYSSIFEITIVSPCRPLFYPIEFLIPSIISLNQRFSYLSHHSNKISQAIFYFVPYKMIKIENNVLI